MLIALAAMFLQQMFASVGKVLPAVLAPLVIAELHAGPAWVGVYYGVSAAASLVVQMGCGSFIVRYGALRMSQVALVLLGGGMAVAAEGWLLGFGASAIIGGGGAAVSTPSSSQLLYRVSPPRLAPLVFSIKQTAVPAGLLICGFLGPAMAAALGWRGTVLLTAVACVVFAVMLQPLRARFDDDRVPSRRFRLSDFRTTIAAVLKARDLRGLSFACFAFNGVQSVFTAYFVTYLVALGYELAAAGFLFSVVVAVAVPCRVLWGWVGSFHVAPRRVMAGLALGMAGSVALTGLFTAAWPVVAMGLVGAVLSATAMSWHGILLSETARLAPAGNAGTVTGGVLSFGQIGALLGPFAFSLLLRLTGGYGAGWALCTIPALWVGISLLRQRPPIETVIGSGTMRPTRG
ncbi:MAG TPA: MFS transporter [Stellaceae bacterium]|nr:MFS transporter [Stellaceae bacterium]HMD64259.1 MFS transporter [Stellaceae bacterium]